MVAPQRRAGTGIPGLDAAIDGLRIGDNVVWHCDTLADFSRVLAPFLAAARAEGRHLVYVRFATHPSLVSGEDVHVHELDPRAGFEPFTLAVHALIAAHGREAFYVFDSLASLLDAWHSDLMVTNFFQVTCPFLYELDTIAAFPLLRGEVSAATVAGIRDTAQVLLDLHVLDDVVHVHPLKVEGRSSPTMFYPHRIDGDAAVPVTSSTAAIRLSARRDRIRRRPDHWTRLVEASYDALEEGGPAAGRAHASLADALLGRDDGKLGTLARRHLTLPDLLVAASRSIGTGHIGGKAIGMLTARAILLRDPQARFAEHLEPHDSFHVGADVFYSYLVSNGWWRHRLEQRSPDRFLAAGAELRTLLPTGTFPPAVREAFVDALEHLGQSPIIVRSSSLLEDNYGNAFAGKYDSFFLANQGSPEDRLHALEDAVRAVYASAMNEDALVYRQTRGLAEADEQMAVLIMRVSGDHHGPLFFPHAAGVGNSDNLYTPDPSLDPDAGMLRLVVGLGTRAVDRTGTDHARLVALADPRHRRLADPEELSAGGQRRVDVLDLAAGRLTSVSLADVVRTDLSAPWSLLVSPDTVALRRLAERGRRSEHPPVVADFAGLLNHTGFPTVMREALAVLEDAYDYPVDIEFTCNLTTDGTPKVAIVQCRPLQTRGPGPAVAMPQITARDDVLFACDDFMGGNVRLPLSHVVTVRAQPYLGLSEGQRHGVARLIGQLNRALSEASFALVGPGRWGTTTASLGVPVRFAEINRAAALVEATHAGGGFLPELSYGSHFFADLVETGIFYAAVFDTRPGVIFRPEVAVHRPNVLTELVADIETGLLEVVHVARFDDLLLASDSATRRVVCLRSGGVSD